MNGRFNGLVCAVCIMFCGLYSVQINAANPAPYIKTQYGYSKKINGGGTWNAVRVDYLIETGNIPEGATIPRNKQLSVVYPKADVISKGKQFKKATPFNLAVIAAVEAAGWAIDELSGQITKPVSVPPNPIDSIVNGGSVFQYPDKESAKAACDSLKNVVDYFSSIGGCRLYTNSNYSPSAPYYTPPQIRIGDTSYYPRFYYGIGPDGISPDDMEPKTEWHPASSSDESQIIDKAIGRASERQLKPLFSDSYSNPYNWPPFWDSLRDWMRDVADRDPNDNVTYDPVSNRWVIGSPSGGPDLDVEVKPVPDPTSPDFDPTENPSSPAGESGQFELPAFCDWATVVCEWLEWTKEEPEEMDPDNLPVKELSVADIQKDYNSGLGGGSCPAAVVTSFMGEQIRFEYDNACWAASNVFKPVLLTIAGIMAAFIIIGASRRAV